MLVLGIDTETTGLDVTKDKVIEVGLVLFDTELGQPVILESFLINDGKGEPIPELIANLTGITSEMITKYGITPEEASARLSTLIPLADYVLAHNGNGFDRPIMSNYFSEVGSASAAINAAKWLDSKIDVPYPDTCRQNNMTYLQGYYKLVNPFAHRALTDILTTVTIVHNNFKWEEIVELYHSPTLRYTSLVGIAQKDLPKSAGFQFNPTTKQWTKDIKEIIVDKKEIKFDFPCNVVTL